MEGILRSEAKKGEESLLKHILLAVKEEKNWREVVQAWTQRKLHLLEFIERDHASTTQTTKDEAAVEDLKKQLSEDYLLLAKEEEALAKRVSELRAAANAVVYPLLQSSLPEGYEMVDMPYHGYFRAEGGRRGEHLAVKKGLNVLLWNDDDEDEGMRVYHVEGVPHGEIVYFWDEKEKTWKELFQSPGLDGMRQWKNEETWVPPEPGWDGKEEPEEETTR